jgi:rRNA maturation protein Nop10
MKKVNIILDYTLTTTCPHCKKNIELQGHDDDGVLGLAMCGTRHQPADWENIGVEWTCQECGEEFEIKDIKL